MKNNKYNGLIIKILIAVGCFLRLFLYFRNPPFWVDESYAAVNISSSSFREIISFFSIFSYQPKVPLLFSVITKFNMLIFGVNEYAFRLLPLVAGIAALFLFAAIIKSFGKIAQIFAMCTFSFSGYLIYYCAEFKPYSVDLFATIFLYLLYEYVKKNKFSINSLRVLSIGVILGMWMSNAAIFVIAVIAILLIRKMCILNDLSTIKYIGFNLCFWFINFIIIFQKIFRPMTTSSTILENSSSVMGPDNILQLYTLKWIGNSFLSFFNNPLGFEFSSIVFIFFLIGMHRLSYLNRDMFIIFIGSFAFALMASIFQKYLVHGRLFLFAAPGLIICVALGVERLFKCSSFIIKGLCVFLCFGMFLYPMQNTYAHLTAKQPHFRSDTSKLIAYLKENFQDGDQIFMNSEARFNFFFYIRKLGFDEFLQKDSFLFKDSDQKDYLAYRMGRFYQKTKIYNNNTVAAFKYETHLYDRHGNFRKIASDVSFDKSNVLLHPEMDRKLWNFPRTWILFSHIPHETKDFLLQSLEAQGKQLKAIHTQSDSLFLYEFTQ